MGNNKKVNQRNPVTGRVWPREWVEGIALLFHDHGTRRGWRVSVTPRPYFTPGKDPVPIVQEAGWAPGPVCTGAENLAPTGIRSPDRPARSRSLYRQSYPAHEWEIILIYTDNETILINKIRGRNVKFWLLEQMLGLRISTVRIWGSGYDRTLNSKHTSITCGIKTEYQEQYLDPCLEEWISGTVLGSMLGRLNIRNSTWIHAWKNEYQEQYLDLCLEEWISGTVLGSMLGRLNISNSTWIYAWNNEYQEQYLDLFLE
jgi:hypothetical protein